MKFVTITGSVYEVDLTENKCRRLSGKKNPQPRQGKDGEWKEYSGIIPTFPKKGRSVTFMWDPLKTELHSDSPKGSLPATITSAVAEILDN